MSVITTIDAGYWDKEKRCQAKECKKITSVKETITIPLKIEVK